MVGSPWLPWLARLRHAPVVVRPRRKLAVGRERRPTPPPAIQSLESRTLLSAPLGRDDQFSLLHDRPFQSPVSLLANDTSLTGNPLTAELVTGPASGVLTLQPTGHFSFTPATAFTGTLQFTYRPLAGLLAGNVTTATLTVGNTLPVARADSYTCTTDRFDSASAGVPSLVANDLDRDGDTLQPVVTSLPAFGSLTLTPGGHFLYIPQPNRFGSVTAPMTVWATARKSR